MKQRKLNYSNIQIPVEVVSYWCPLHCPKVSMYIVIYKATMIKINRFKVTEHKSKQNNKKCWSNSKEGKKEKTEQQKTEERNKNQENGRFKSKHINIY